jgi:hypothetical protein
VLRKRRVKPGGGLAGGPLGATHEASGTSELREADWQAFEAIDATPASSRLWPSWTGASSERTFSGANSRNVRLCGTQ